MFWPWGSVLLRYAYNRGAEIVAQPADSNYWARSIHLDGYRSVAVLSRSALNARTFARIHAPLFLGYYYRDEKNQDPTLSVAAMLAMFDKLGTRGGLKHKQDFPEANARVIASSLHSGSADVVHRSSRDFLQQVVGVPLVADTTASSDSGTIAQAH